VHHSIVVSAAVWPVLIALDLNSIRSSRIIYASPLMPTVAIWIQL